MFFLLYVLTTRLQQFRDFYFPAPCGARDQDAFSAFLQSQSMCREKIGNISAGFKPFLLRSFPNVPPLWAVSGSRLAGVPSILDE